MDLLANAVALEEKASSFGFSWETTGQIMDQIQSEIAEINEHLNPDEVVLTNQVALQDEIGDLLQTLS